MKVQFLAICLLLASASPGHADQKEFFIQAIHTESRAKAESVKNDLKRFRNVQIYQQNDRFTVRIGPVADGKKAIQIRNTIKNKYPDVFIRLSNSTPVKAKTVNPERVKEKPKKVPAPVAQVPPVAPSPSISGNQEIQAPESAIKTTETPVIAATPDSLLKEAADHYRSRRYEDALQQLSLFLSLYPENGNVPSAMFAVAGILLEMKRPLSALRIYSRIIERHPESPEATDSILALTDMSIISPGLKPSITLSGAQWYLDPVAACDALLSKNPPAELMERLLFRRIFALRSKGRHRDAYDAGIQFLMRYPEAKQRYELAAALKVDLTRLVDECIASGDEITAVNMSAQALRQGLIKMTDTDIMIKTARSYNRLGLAEEAGHLLKGARPFAAARTPQIDAAIEELTRNVNSAAAPSPSAVTQRWALYETGRQQIGSSNSPAAEKTFAQMKELDQDEFWSKLADFTLKDATFMNKYRNYVNFDKRAY